LIRDQKHRQEQGELTMRKAPEAKVAREAPVAIAFAPVDDSVDLEAVDPVDSVDEADGSANSVDEAVVNAPPTPPYPSPPYAVVRDPAAEPVAPVAPT
jgi:hypothetical protein